MPFDMSWDKKRKPMRKQSKKRARMNAIRSAEAHRVYGRYPVCHACPLWRLIGISQYQTGCNGLADDLHELVPRGRGGSITDMDNCRPVSRACHDYAHSHPEAAEAAGLILPGEGSSKIVSRPRSLPG